MNRNTIFWLFLSTALMLPIGHVSADELVLKNGDRMTGSFLKLEAGSLTFETGYAGNIQVQVDQVVSMTTDVPLLSTKTILLQMPRRNGIPHLCSYWGTSSATDLQTGIRTCGKNSQPAGHSG